MKISNLKLLNTKCSREGIRPQIRKKHLHYEGKGLGQTPNVTNDSELRSYLSVN